MVSGLAQLAGSFPMSPTHFCCADTFETHSFVTASWFCDHGLQGALADAFCCHRRQTAEFLFISGTKSAKCCGDSFSSRLSSCAAPHKTTTYRCSEGCNIAA